MSVATATQYTVRNVPPRVDRYLRREAARRGRSLNQVIVDELSKAAGDVPRHAEDPDWLELFGQGFDPEVAAFLEEDDRLQKELTRREWGLDAD